MNSCTHARMGDTFHLLCCSKEGTASHDLDALCLVCGLIYAQPAAGHSQEQC